VTIVLDASAMLAFMFAESGASVVEGCLDDAVMSTVNTVEVLQRLRDEGSDTPEQDFAAIAIRVVAFDADQAITTAALRPLTRHLGLSLGDRACLALAQHLKAPVLTADRAWAGLDLGVDIRVIR
jgi:ribonuclease VapC